MENNTNVQKINLVLSAIKLEQKRGTATALKRAQELTRHLENSTNDCGWFGRCCEIMSHTDNSKKFWVASQNRPDTYMKMEINGKIRYIECERKTNGGRIGSLYKKKGAPKYIIYSMLLQNSIVKNTREIPPLIIPTELFLKILDECNATKNTNGKNPEIAIQVSSKKFYEKLLDYPIPYDANLVYTPDDFEGLEV